MTRKLDLLQDCNDQRIPASQFKETFCNRCRNSQCVNAKWADSVWLQRMMTQEDKLIIRPNFAHPLDPKFEPIRGLHFREVTTEEIVLNSRDPWAGPGVHMATPDTATLKADAVDRAVAALGGKPVASTMDVVTTPDVVLEPPRVDPPNVEQPNVMAMNTPFNPNGVMLDGSDPVPQTGKKPIFAPEAIDPWAPPPPKPKIVPVGAKIKMGS